MTRIYGDGRGELDSRWWAFQTKVSKLATFKAISASKVHNSVVSILDAEACVGAGVISSKSTVTIEAKYILSREFDAKN